MKVITKVLSIGEERYVLISDVNPKDNSVYYGTINYKDIDENGKLKRKLNGFEMCIAETISQAIERRMDTNELMKITEGMTNPKQIAETIMNYIKEKKGVRI